jgi:hypothetical protein
MLEAALTTMQLSTLGDIFHYAEKYYMLCKIFFGSYFL